MFIEYIVNCCVAVQLEPMASGHELKVSGRVAVHGGQPVLLAERFDPAGEPRARRTRSRGDWRVRRRWRRLQRGRRTVRGREDARRPRAPRFSRPSSRNDEPRRPARARPSSDRALSTAPIPAASGSRTWRRRRRGDAGSPRRPTHACPCFSSAETTSRRRPPSAVISNSSAGTKRSAASSTRCIDTLPSTQVQSMTKV